MRVRSQTPALAALCLGLLTAAAEVSFPPLARAEDPGSLTSLLPTEPRAVTRAPATTSAPLDFVFDLDDTLIRWIRPEEKVPEHVLLKNADVNGYRYRLVDGAAELIQSVLEIPGARVSFFSLGEEPRNLAVLKEIILPDGRSAYDVAYKILSKHEATHLGDKEVKDLRKINPDLERVILLDDNHLYRHPDQTKNCLLIGDRPLFHQTELREGFLGAEDFYQDRNKLARARGVLELARQRARAEGKSLVDALWDVQFQAGRDGQAVYRTELLTDMNLYRAGRTLLTRVNPRYQLTPLLPGKPGLGCIRKGMAAALAEAAKAARP